MLLEFLILHKKTLTKEGQKALQKWLKQSIGTPIFSDKVNLLKKHAPSLSLACLIAQFLDDASTFARSRAVLLIDGYPTFQRALGRVLKIINGIIYGWLIY